MLKIFLLLLLLLRFSLFVIYSSIFEQATKESRMGRGGAVGYMLKEGIKKAYEIPRRSITSFPVYTHQARLNKCKAQKQILITLPAGIKQSE
jgi:hypothetical protein